MSTFVSIRWDRSNFVGLHMWWRILSPLNSSTFFGHENPLSFPGPEGSYWYNAGWELPHKRNCMFLECFLSQKAKTSQVLLNWMFFTPESFMTSNSIVSLKMNRWCLKIPSKSTFSTKKKKYLGEKKTFVVSVDDDFQLKRSFVQWSFKVLSFLLHLALSRRLKNSFLWETRPSWEV